MVARVPGVGGRARGISQRRQVSVGVKRGALVTENELLISGGVGGGVQCSYERLLKPQRLLSWRRVTRGNRDLLLWQPNSTTHTSIGF